MSSWVRRTSALLMMGVAASACGGRDAGGVAAQDATTEASSYGDAATVPDGALDATTFDATPVDSAPYDAALPDAASADATAPDVASIDASTATDAMANADATDAATADSGGDGSIDVSAVDAPADDARTDSDACGEGGCCPNACTDGDLKCLGSSLIRCESVGPDGCMTWGGSQLPCPLGCSNGACVDPIAVTAGNLHTCALLSDGTARCWGVNTVGELGNGGATNSPTPVRVLGLAGLTTISAHPSGAHTCAVTSTGDVSCWGDNQSEQLSSAATTPFSAVPVTVPSLQAIGIAAGSGHTCALLADGSVSCWGDNSSGQFGNGTTGFSPVPAPATLPAADATNVAAGDGYTCDLRSGGGVDCWGKNSSGQLGSGLTTINYATPQAVASLSSGVTAIATGESHSCALLSGGTVECWGDNLSGQLGNNSTANSETPVAVTGLDGIVTAIAAGEYHTCAVISGGEVECWGANDSGQLGGASSGSSAVPGAVGLPGVATAIGAGGSHTCAVIATGDIVCWGANSYGQLGNGTTTASATPVQVSW